MPETILVHFCTTCKQEKPISEFYESTLRVGSHRCKECNRIYQRFYHNDVYYPKHKDRRRRRARDKKTYDNERNKRPDVLMKRHARISVIHAIERGEMKRSPHCERCGVICKTNAHHHKGYEDENRFDVQWLCSPCHYFIHRKNSYLPVNNPPKPLPNEPPKLDIKESPKPGCDFVVP